MQVRDIMSADFEIASPQTTLRQAAEMMRDGDYGYLPIGDDNRLKGALTDRDIVVRAVAGGQDMERSVEVAMSERVIYCFEDDDIVEAADLMKNAQIRRLAVLNDDKRMVGIVTLGDIARVGHNNALTGDIEARVVEAH